jgi:2-polyprenyl-3-methyl-5-hydroxy-6-metoxy-1,4-benzoquinol methylase
MDPAAPRTGESFRAYVPPAATTLFDCCPLGCDSSLEATAVILPEGPLRRCPQCDLRLASCSPAQYEASLHKWDTAQGTTPDARSAQRFRTVARRRLGAVLRQLPATPTARLLDVGCSSGSLLAVAAEMGFAVTGVETAPAAAEAARRAGFEVHLGALEEAALAPASFDVITLIELIEHLTEPLAMMQACHRLLRPGGIVLISTPNPASWTARVLGARWEGFSLVRLGGHICFYSPAAIRALAQRTGFDVIGISTRNLRLAEPEDSGPAKLRAAKLVAELFAHPARWFGRGHDLLALLGRHDFGTRPSR